MANLSISVSIKENLIEETVKCLGAQHEMLIQSHFNYDQLYPLILKL